MTTTLTTLAVDRIHVTKVVDAATGSGTGSSNPFTKHPAADSADLLVVAASGVYSAAVMDLQQSDDNGGTWQVAVSGWDAFSQPVNQIQIAENVLYRFHVTSFTGTSVTINASTTGEDIFLTTRYTANEVLASPDGVPGFLVVRSLVANDIPVLPSSKIPVQNVLKVETLGVNPNTLLGSPIQIVPTPGNNFMIRPLSVGVTYHGLGNTAYDVSAGGDLALFYGTNEGFGGQHLALDKTILTEAADEIGFFNLSGFNGFDTHDNTENKALMLSQLGPSEFTTGNAPVQIEVLYLIVPVH
jgi:hypothetical protein